MPVHTQVLTRVQMYAIHLQILVAISLVTVATRQWLSYLVQPSMYNEHGNSNIKSSSLVCHAETFNVDSCIAWKATLC